MLWKIETGEIFQLQRGSLAWRLGDILRESFFHCQGAFLPFRKEISGGFSGDRGEEEWYVWRVEEDSFTVSAVSLALEVDLRRLKLNRALQEKGILVYC